MKQMSASMNETKAKPTQSQVKPNGECKLVSLTNEQRVRIFIKCNAIRTNRNHNANCWMMATLFYHISADTHTCAHAQRLTNICGYIPLHKHTWGFQFSIVFSLQPMCTMRWHFIRFSFEKIIHDSQTVWKMHENTTLRREHTNTDYFAIQKSLALKWMVNKMNGTQNERSNVCG